MDQGDKELHGWLNFTQFFEFSASRGVFLCILPFITVFLYYPTKVNNRWVCHLKVVLPKVVYFGGLALVEEDCAEFEGAQLYRLYTPAHLSSKPNGTCTGKGERKNIGQYTYRLGYINDKARKHKGN